MTRHRRNVPLSRNPGEQDEITRSPSRCATDVRLFASRRSSETPCRVHRAVDKNFCARYKTTVERDPASSSCERIPVHEPLTMAGIVFRLAGRKSNVTRFFSDPALRIQADTLRDAMIVPPARKDSNLRITWLGVVICAQIPMYVILCRVGSR